jgi:hypothetical protein
MCTVPAIGSAPHLTLLGEVELDGEVVSWRSQPFIPARGPRAGRSIIERISLMGDLRTRLSRGTRLAAVTVLAGLGTLAFTSPAQADPPGANGTIKIDGPVYDLDINNEPHVDCGYRVKFFGFDKNQYANIVFSVHPPSGPGVEVLRQDNKLISDDPAAGGLNDPDAIFQYSADQLGLGDYKLHPKQGYHVKLDVELIGVPGNGKHKVFWLQPCESNVSESPSTPPSTPGSPPPSPSVPGAGGGLPITGPAAGGIALAGLGLTGAGVALVVMRRRRGITFTS